ncbi:MAG: hypothetical protein J6Q19_00560 [Bacteroidaceae bacterium]|nr:hypothetical protein [Bacteroidaceae bacterium]
MNENNVNTTPAENNVDPETAVLKKEFELHELKKGAFEVTAAGEGRTVRESTTGDTAKLFNAVSGASDPVKSLLGQEVEVTDIVVTSADVHEDKDDEDSPLENRPVVHFYTSDGKHYSSLSNGIVRTTKALLECGICPTKENPIKVRFRTVETRRGTAHIFELV